MDKSLINVGIAQLKTGAKATVLRTILGSCIGICIYDRIKKVGGMVHILLPNSIQGKDIKIPEKYAESAIPLLVERLLKEGAKKETMSAKIAGGASMFKFESSISLGQIGERNIAETKKVLEKLKIPLLQEDVGGNVGRVINFFLQDGRLAVRAAGKEKLYYKI